ncbi:MAG: flagellar basal body rod protein FlgG [Candidatus Eremiobacter antarcticus]|nr:flagellar hook-basal body protein [Candidatus Eremiobacteraeota bacterium]PZR60852.1 MAG: flagellar basal body rod protein FlgG [Candidatus Eremiobacter sp. RRmetagenome_bin22]
MNRTLAVAAAGMATQQLVLDDIAANLANVDVPGFRVSRADFAALITADGRAIAPQTAAPQRLFTQGRLDFTNNDHDLAVDGEGLFAVRTTGGQLAFTRAGNFESDRNGRLRLPNGAALDGVRLPAATTSVRVDENGRIACQVAGRRGDIPGGRVRLVTFDDNAALRLDPDGLFHPAAAAGHMHRASDNNPLGRIKQRYLERANVTVVSAMMAVLAAQRAYEANAKAVQAADEMLRLANNLERG